MIKPFALIVSCLVTCTLLAAPATQEVHPPIPIRFTLKEPGFVSLVIEEANGMRVRNLVSEAAFPAGDNIAWWDGLDDLGRDAGAASHFTYSIPGKLVSAGKYRARGLVRPEIGLRYEMTPYNEGNPPWRTKDRASEWLANHTPPAAVLFLPEGTAPDRPGHPAPGGQILAGAFVSEGGSGLAWLDLDGHKINGQLWIGGVWTGATQLARDDGDKPVPGIYAYTGAAWTGDKYNGNRPELRLFTLTTDRAKAPQDQRFGTGEDKPLLTPNYALPAGLSLNEHEGVTPLGGLAVRNGIVVVSITPIGQLLFVDAAAHKTLATAPLDRPHGVAFEKSGKLLAVSGRQIVRISLPAFASNAPTTQQVSLVAPEIVVSAGLDDPQQLALDTTGNIYVTDRGSSHQVKVFAPDGKPLRAIGHAGKPSVGPYDPNHMNNPYGLTIDGKDRLWVAEQDKTPKRVSVWSLDGKLLNAFYGPAQYGGGGELDPLERGRFFYADEGGMEFKIDWQRGKSRPVSLYYRRDCDGWADDAAFATQSGRPPQTPIHVNGRTYLVDCYNSSPTNGVASATVWLLDGGVARRVAVVGRANDWPMLNPTAAFSARWTGQILPRFSEEYTFTPQMDDGVRLWVDGRLIVDHWKTNNGAPIPVGKIALVAGKPADLRVEYFQKGGSARAVLQWESASQKKQVVPTESLYPVSGMSTLKAGTGICGEYYAGTDFKELLDQRIDPKIDFNWGEAGFTPDATPFQSRLPAGANLAKDKVLFAWSDLNGDGKMQPEEITTLTADTLGVCFMSDLSAITASGLVLKPQGFTPRGAPVYDAAKAIAVMPGTQRPTSSGGGQAILGRDGKVVFTVAPKPFAPQSIGGGIIGKATWSYPSLWPGLHASHSAPLPDRPGELIGTTRLLGNTITPAASDAGEIFAVNGNKGNVYLMTTDGLFVATLFKDCRTASWSYPEAKRGMPVDDASLAEENFWPFITQLTTGEIYLQATNSALVRVDGLEKIHRLPATDIDVTPQELAAAQEYFVQSEAQRQATAAGAGAQKLIVPIRAAAPVVDGKLDDWPAAQWATVDVRTGQVGDWGKRKLESKAAVCVAGDKLYAAFQTDDAKLLTNSGDSPHTLFKTGGALDLMIGADPGADPKRRSPAAGDVRLLVAQVKGKTLAMLYRPVAPGGKTEPVPFSSPLRTVRFDRVEDVSVEVTLAVFVEREEKAKKETVAFELSVPLSVLGLKPQPGQNISADIGLLRGNGFQTLQRVYWNNKATGITSDEPSEADLTPQLWGRWEFKQESAPAASPR